MATDARSKTLINNPKSLHSSQSSGATNSSVYNSTRKLVDMSPISSHVTNLRNSTKFSKDVNYSISREDQLQASLYKELELDLQKAMEEEIWNEHASLNGAISKKELIHNSQKVSENSEEGTLFQELGNNMKSENKKNLWKDIKYEPIAKKRQSHFKKVEDPSAKDKEIFGSHLTKDEIDTHYFKEDKAILIQVHPKLSSYHESDSDSYSETVDKIPESIEDNISTSTLESPNRVDSNLNSVMDPEDESLVDQLLEENLSGIQKLEELSMRISQLETSLNSSGVNTKKVELRKDESKSNKEMHIEELYEIIGYLEKRLEQERESKVNSSISEQEAEEKTNVTYQELKARFKVEQERWNKEKLEFIRQINGRDPVPDQSWKKHYQQLLAKYTKQNKTLLLVKRQMNDKLENILTQKSTLQEDYDLLREEIAQKAQSEKKLKKELIIASNDLEETKKCLEDSNQEIALLKEQLKKLQELETPSNPSDITIQSNTSKAADKTEANLLEIEQLKQRSSELLKENMELRDKISQYNSTNSDKKESMNESTVNLLKENAKLKSILEGFSQELENYEELQEKVEKMNSIIKKQKDDNAQLRYLLHKTKNTGLEYATTLKSENEDLKKQIRRLKAKLQVSNASEEIGPNLREIS